MIKFEKIQPGAILWDVRKSTGWSRYKWDFWPVYIQEVDGEKRRVLASWNYNKPEWMYEQRVTKLRANRPAQVAK